MVILADAGSTKIDWLILDKNKDITIKTDGINPAVMTQSQISDILQRELRPLLLENGVMDSVNSKTNPENNIEVHYYGAGCTPPNIPKMKTMLHEIFGQDAKIEVESDLTAAARALFGNNKGIACILGTGSNSGLYDGQHIVYKVPAMGYILGDEGSGAVLGRLFLNALYKGRLPEELLRKFETQFSTTLDDIISNVYHGSSPSKFLASTSVFIARHLDIKQVEDIVIDNFRSFFRNNIKHYSHPELEVGIAGSIASIYHEQLMAAADMEDIRIRMILKSPSERLAAFHKMEVNRV